MWIPFLTRVMPKYLPSIWEKASSLSSWKWGRWSKTRKLDCQIKAIDWKLLQHISIEMYLFRSQYLFMVYFLPISHVYVNTFYLFLNVTLFIHWNRCLLESCSGFDCQNHECSRQKGTGGFLWFVKPLIHELKDLTETLQFTTSRSRVLEYMQESQPHCLNNKHL